jgi:hypothetical protein
MVNKYWMEKYSRLPELKFNLQWGEATIDIEVRYDWHEGFHSIDIRPDICIPLTDTGFYHEWYIKENDNDYPQESDMKEVILTFLGEEPKQLNLFN